MDQMHKKTNKTLKGLERRLQTEYKLAYEEVSKKLLSMTKRFQKEDAKKRVLLSNGVITHEQYIAWRRDWMIKGGRLQAIQKSLAEELVKTNVTSMDIINATSTGVFTDNINFGAYEVEHGFGMSTNFSLYDQNSVMLLADDAHLYKHINIAKDMRWNTNKISSALLQGIIQGESIEHIAKRLKTVTDTNQTSAVRNARTMITGAENAGRLQGYKDMAKQGLHAKKMWMATLSDRTRDSHRLMDLKTADIDKPFENGLMYPGDPNGNPGEVYNCRCTMVAKMDYYDPAKASRWSELPEYVTYEKWKRGKKHGNDISDNG